MYQANPKAIGGFIVGGLVLLVAGLVTFGSFKFFAQRIPIVMYFDGDLSGLDPGAPLVFRGVRIGTVTDVQLHFDSRTRQVAIPVFAEVEPDRFVVEGGLKGGGNLEPMIKAGLRAQLASQSMLTGKLMVQIDFLPDTPIRLVGSAGRIPEVPTVPSTLAMLKASVEGVLQKIQDMPLPQLVSGLQVLIGDADTAVKRLDTSNLAAVSDAAVRALNDLQGLIASVVRHIDTLAPVGEATIKDADLTMLEARRVLLEVRPLLASLQRTADGADNLMARAQDVIAPGSPAYRELVALLREFTNAARSTRALADDLERNPDSILFGKASARSVK